MQFLCNKLHLLCFNTFNRALMGMSKKLLHRLVWLLVTLKKSNEMRISRELVCRYRYLVATRQLCMLTFNPLMGTLTPHCNGPLYGNRVIGILAVDGWAVIFGTARRGLGGLWPRPVPSLLYTKFNSPLINFCSIC